MSSVIDKLKSKTWIQNNTFKVVFYSGPFVGLEYCIKSINMPDFTRSAVEEYNNGTWQFAPGRQEMYQIAITFLDNDEDRIYDKALENWVGAHQKYRDDISMSFSVFTTSKRNRAHQVSSVVSFPEAIIDSISGAQWDNSSQNQLLEFTINFKAEKIVRERTNTSHGR